MPRLILLLLSLYTLSAKAQNITGVVLDENGAPLTAVTVSLLTAKDSTTQKFTVTNAQGKFSLAVGKEGSYTVCASSVGYAVQCSPTLTASPSTTQELKLVLAKQPASLKEVTVTARRPLLEVKADRMVVNVEGTLNSTGTTALEILRKSPGVNVDNDDNISLSGKSGVQVYIDGRLSPLSGADLSNYLSSLQSAGLDAIEIISNPSAKYEAAGNGGVINIRLKKNRAYGTNGSVNAGYGYGKYAKYNGGFSLNHRTERINLFGSYTYARNRNFVRTLTYRELADSIFDQKAGRVISEQPHNIQVGMDYFLSKASTVGVLVNALPGRQLIENRSTTPIYKSGRVTPDRILDAMGIGTYERGNTNVNANYRLAATSHELNVDADYARYHLDLDQFQPNSYYDKDYNFLYSRTYRMISPSTINMRSLKLSYDVDAGKGKLSVGGKYGFVNSDNTLQRYNVLGSTEQYDSLRSNDFTYKENINALYVRYNRAYKELALQVGLRAENTQVRGYSQGYRWIGSYQVYDSTFTRGYTDLFPSASISFKKRKNSQFSLNAGRRIDRPAYQDLNPFEFKIDEYVYRRGNTDLRPQYTTTIEGVHVYKDKVTTILGYSHVNDVFTQIFDTIDVSRSFITRTNVATQDIVNLMVNYAIQKGRYTGFFNINPSYNNYRSNFGKDRDLHLEAFAYTVKTQHGYKFNRGFAAELALLYNSPGIGLGFFQGRATGSVDIALAKTALNNKLSIKAAMSDLFFTMRNRGHSLFAGQYMEVERSFEPRLFRLNIAYRFGSQTVKGARQRKTLLDEEKGRLQSSN